MATRNKKASNAVKKSAAGGTFLSVLTGMGAMWLSKKLGISLDDSLILTGGAIAGAGTLTGAAVAYASKGGREGESH